MEQLMTRLKLAGIRESYQDWIKKAIADEMSYMDFLKALLEEEACARDDNGLKKRIRYASFPYEKGIDQFEFKYRPEIKKQVIQHYLSSCFVEEGRSIVFIGSAGLGKTHLSISIGLKMIQYGYKVKFTTVQDLINKYSVENTLAGKQKILKPFIKCDLLILDELGYLPYNSEVAPALYQLIANRYEKSATIITSNKSLNEWGNVLSDTALAAAIIDRLMHHGEVYHLKGKSYRLLKKRMAG